MKNIMQKNREQILAWQKLYRAENAEILKSRRKCWYENNRKRLASRTRRTLEITEDNTVN